MFCNKCGQEIPDGSSFCNKCGNKMISENQEEQQLEQIKFEDTPKPNFNLSKKIKTLCSRRNIAIVGVSLLVILCIFLGIAYLNNTERKYKNYIDSNKYIEANKLYNSKIKGNKNTEAKINTFLKDDINKIQQSFIDEKIDFDKTKKELETIKDTGLVSNEVNDALNKVNSLNNSTIAFKKAEEYVKNNDFVNAIKEYKDVISDDKNYPKAEQQIQTYQKKYKDQVIKNAEDYANKQDYDKALSALVDAVAIFPNDSDITAKKSVYEKLQADKLEAEKKQKVEKAKTEQLVIIDSSKIMVQDSQYKSLYPDMLQAIAYNKSDKTIKNMNIGFLGYDANNYPLKIKAQFNFSGGTFEFIGKAENINIIAGGRFGDNVGWKLDENHGISKVLACIKDVTFYDGTTWDNPYYEYWLEQYKEKPLN